VLVAPRSQLDQLSKREELRRTGVYVLVGPDPDDPSRALASIGEGDSVLRRLLRRNKNEAKDCWERTVVHSQLLMSMTVQSGPLCDGPKRTPSAGS